MGDNYRRALAYPRREGMCPECGRWLGIGAGNRIPRHQCCQGVMGGGHKPAQINPPDSDPKEGA